MKKLLISLFLVLMVVGCNNANDPIIEQTVTEKNPTSNFNYSSTSPRAGQTVIFSNTSIDGVTYSWDFGDNTKSTLSNPTKVFSSGVWTVSLTSYSKTKAKSNTVTKTINVLPAFTSLYVSKYTVNKISFLTSSSTSWDSSSGPDILLDFYDNTTSKSVFETGYVLDVVQSDIPYNTTLGLTFTTLSKSYTIYMYDYDVLANDYMTSFTFNIPTYIPNYPTTAVLTNGNFQITLTLEWK